METGSLTRYTMRELGVLYAAWLVLCVMVFNHAWVAEDAYITFRVIDNFSQGYGLRWNIYERVQVYTHPLWMLLHIPLYAIWHNLYQVTLGLSIVCSMAAILVVLASTRKSLPVTLVCFFLPLMLSRAYMDYTTSGLENPLSYLLFATFGYLLLNHATHRYFWFLCSLNVALAMLNRLDSITLYAPVLAWLAHTRRNDLNRRQAMLGMLPLVAWLAFSLFYYGFLFPNTKYAKLNTGLGTLLYLQQGLHYAKFLAVIDTISALFLLIAPTALAIALWRNTLPSPAMQLRLAIAAGICINMVYVICIGGDYMAGRFWALPVFASVWLGYIMTPEKLRLDIVFCIACVCLVSYIIPKTIGEIRQSCGSCVVGKERLINAYHIFRDNKLVLNLLPLEIRREGEYTFAKDGKKLAQESPPPVKTMFYIGMTAFYAGPHVSAIDELGLADPLLARLPASSKRSFYIGHFKRDIPKGYVYAVKTGSTEKMDPALARYYEKLRIITSDDLLDPQRLLTIIAFNMGIYDHWKQDYVRRNAP